MQRGMYLLDYKLRSRASSSVIPLNKTEIMGPSKTTQRRDLNTYISMIQGDLFKQIYFSFIDLCQSHMLSEFSPWGILSKNYHETCGPI